MAESSQKSAPDFRDSPANSILYAISYFGAGYGQHPGGGRARSHRRSEPWPRTHNR